LSIVLGQKVNSDLKTDLILFTLPVLPCPKETQTGESNVKLFYHSGILSEPHPHLSILETDPMLTCEPQTQKVGSF
jgi:hypothetical protein